MIAEAKVRTAVDKLPYAVQSALKWSAKQPGKSKRAMRLAWDKYRIVSAGRTGKPVRILDFDVRINGGE